MRTSTLILPALLAIAVLHPAAAAARNYDCTKSGNANKAACRTNPTTPAAAPAALAAGTTPKVAAAPARSAIPAARHYDCLKPGNANKVVCKGAAAPAAAAATSSVPVAPVRATVARPAAPSPAAMPVRPAAAVAPAAAGPTASAARSPRIVPWTTKTGKLVHYDCSKVGNFAKKACKQ